ncbi:MAG: hypothetical protein ABFS03_00725 [Chloroflexota bacterium]
MNNTNDDALIKKVVRMGGWFQVEGSKVSCIDKAVAKQIIALIRSKENDGWVSVEDRLPDHFNKIDCYHPAHGVRVSWLSRSGKYIRIGLVNDRATYWRERPQPPIEKDADNE